MVDTTGQRPPIMVDGVTSTDKQIPPNPHTVPQCFVLEATIGPNATNNIPSKFLSQREDPAAYCRQYVGNQITMALREQFGENNPNNL